MNDSIRLVCILIDNDLKVRDSPFAITVPPSEDIGGVIHFVKEVTPSLNDKDHGKFRFYKPPSDHPVPLSQSFNGFQLTRENLGSPLPVACKINEVFRGKGADHRFDADVIVHVDEEHGGIILHTSPAAAESSNSLLRYVTFRLRNRNEIQLPPVSRLLDNNISELPMDEALPEFVEQLERELLLQRSPRHDMTTLPLLDSVKILLGDEVFREYFTDPKPESATHRATAVELLHYIDILLDQNLSNQEGYRDNAESRVYSLLRRFTWAPQRGAKLLFDVPWPFSLVAEIVQDDMLYQYTPCSNFSIIAKDFPYLLLGVSPKGDVCRMLLQASCLVRLGNALLTDKSSFFAKAIYVDRDYRAVEYTLYQRESELSDKVEYCKRSYDLSDRRDMFLLVFRLYNFLYSMRALHEKLSSRLTAALTSVLTETENLPHLKREHGSNDNNSSIWRDQDAGDSTTGITLRNPRMQALIQRDGYTLLPEGSMRLKPTLGKAISNSGRAGIVALKLLDSATGELQILRRLHVIRSEANHTIKLLDILPLNIPPASIVHNVIVMPWQMPLSQCLMDDYFPDAVKSLRVQFLEGVVFLHENGIAHLDLKPANILVDGKRGSSPRLSIIDFGLSVFVKSEETTIVGYRGTPSWVAPEAGTEHGPVMEYSAVLADRWSCGQMLMYLAKFLPAGSASVSGFTCPGLLCSDPRKRPPLREVLRSHLGSSARKRRSDANGAIVEQKRFRALW